MKKRKSSLDKRLKRIDRELKAVRRHVGSLSKSVEKGVLPDSFRGQAAAETGTGVPVDEQEALHGQSKAAADERQGIADGSRDERFTDYLASSFQSVRPLRHERKIQRNRAVFMIVFAALLLFLLIWRFLV